jgi:hypothetical protein
MESKMKSKIQLITDLQTEFNQWELFLAGLSHERINSSILNSNWTIKDVIAHLMAWQMVSNARMDAALLKNDPKFPDWLAGNDPESEENLENYNDRIYQIHERQPWDRVYQMWKEGFQKLIKTTELIPEEELIEPGRFVWLGEHPLSAVLDGLYEHHLEHHIPDFKNFQKTMD